MLVGKIQEIANTPPLSMQARQIVGNEGNHILTVVIPSVGAVNGGMRDGHFVVNDYNNHYSLLRTIEDALGLAPLTNNDRYAEPMNDYWKPPIIL